VGPAELAAPSDAAADRRVEPDLDWLDSRVPMVHVPLRRPQSR
jgi:hypothetical protein